ncbi:MAG TPA: FtsX-like permease family protein [Polyangia bacterium]|jgi:lipoprotein-releasing system permease protein|nr:FtsX-like permease family protein [Polyangia bacterium]
MPVARGFEWFVAWRHLRDPERKSRKTLYFGLAALAFAALCLLAVRFAPHLPLLRRTPFPGAGDWMPSRPSVLVENLKTVGVVAAIAGVVLTILGALFATFTVFTAISIFGVFLGTGAPIIALSVMSGFEADLKTKIRATKADIVVSAAEDKPFTDWESVQKRLNEIPEVVSSMAYVESEVIVKHATNPSGMGIILRGIDPAAAPKVLDFARTLREGKVDWLAHPASIPTEDADLLRDVPSGGKGEGEGDAGEGPAKIGQAGKPVHDVLPGILLGEELFAHTLRVYVGSDVDIACPMCGVGPTGPMPKLKPFRVAGHFYTGMYEFDSKLAYVSLAEAQKFLGMQGEITGIEVRTTHADHAPALAERISKLLGPGYEVRSWEELNKGLFMALRLEKIAMFVVLTFIALVASFSIISNLIMLVTEKAREVAILKSMGARDGAILRVFIAEGLYIGLLGLGLGLALGVSGCLMLARWGLPLDPDVYYIQQLPVVMRGGEIAAISLAALGLCCLATLYPAFLASRMRPVEGLRYE